MAEPRKPKLYTAYEFKDHDPVIDQLHTMMDDEGLKASKVAALSGLSTTTINNWFNRKITPSHKPTKRPQFASVMAFTRSLGYDLRFVRPERAVTKSGIVFQRNIRAKSSISNGTAAQP
jgi:hypothetical protein